MEKVTKLKVKTLNHVSITHMHNIMNFNSCHCALKIMLNCSFCWVHAVEVEKLN